MRAMRWEAITTGFYLEGLAIEENGDIWFSDVVKGGLHRLKANGERQSWLTDKQFIAALALNHDGRVLFTGAHGIGWLDPDTGESGSVLDTIDGAPVPGVNELAVDDAGGVYFGTIDLISVAKGGRPGPSALYHLHTNGKLVRLVDGLKFSNGLGLSPDGKQLYHNETFTATFRYEIGANDTLGASELLLDNQDGDGMAIDIEGGAWVSGCRSNTLKRLQPSGGVQGFDVPSEACTNVRFGPNGDSIFVNVVTLDSVNAIVAGNLIKSDCSTLYRAPSPVRGLPQQRTRFQLA
jgi:sugar lactone lactonase YvrE